MSNHYYTPAGEPMHWVPKADGKGTRNTTIADARKLGLYPGVTTVLECLDKPALVEWKIRQAVAAVLTSPRVAGEELDAFVTRVLDTDREQDQEAKAARDRGTEVHAALDDVFQGKDCPEHLRPWVDPAVKSFTTLGGQVLHTEKILVGRGYAGRCDLILRFADYDMIVDFKTSKTLPKVEKGSWPEHRLQLAAYAQAWSLDPLSAVHTPEKETRVANLYISTIEPGKLAFTPNEHWDEDWMAFRSVLAYWTWLKGYDPILANAQKGAK
jgi:ATP-dependent exoDNAse (exonuclease V) beta subunit